jgi:aminomethyltransferase
MRVEGVNVGEDVQTLKQTALTERHKALGARMVPFAGWEMPVQYEGILAEHAAVRERAGLFDLGHMGQVEVTGPDALEFLQYSTTNDVSSLQPGEAKYGLLPNENGGIVDDIIVYRYPEGKDGYLVCVNASNTGKDLAHWQSLANRRRDLSVNLRDLSPTLGMIAIQGPRAVEIVKQISSDAVEDIGPFSWRSIMVAGVNAYVARTGYTGEDGYEFYAPQDNIGVIWDALMSAGEHYGIAPVGLGARDTLRLEARMPLYGQELSDTINPYEAGLGWAVSLTKGDFVGREQMAAVKDKGADRRTVGFVTQGRTGAPRPHCEVQVAGRTVGEVTSGTFSPTLQRNIGLALVERDVAGVGKPLQIIVRGKPVEAVQVKVPFYKRTVSN